MNPVVGYMLVKALEQREYAKDNVYFDSSISTRKYITIGDSLIGLGHLDTENKKHRSSILCHKSYSLTILPPTLAGLVLSLKPLP